MAAVFKPLFAAEAANDVLPHSLIVGTARVPKANFGSTMMISLPARSGAFSANAKETDDSAPPAELPNRRWLCDNIGAVSAFDGSCVAETAWQQESPTAAVRVTSLASCDRGLVVVPVAIDTVHCVNAFRACVLAVSCSVAMNADVTGSK